MQPVQETKKIYECHDSAEISQIPISDPISQVAIGAIQREGLPLPTEILLIVFEKINPKYVALSRRVCRQFFIVLDPTNATINNFWYKACVKRFPNSQFEPSINFYENYKVCIIEDRLRREKKSKFGDKVLFFGAIAAGLSYLTRKPAKENQEEGNGLSNFLKGVAVVSFMGGASYKHGSLSPADSEDEGSDIESDTDEIPTAE